MAFTRLGKLDIKDATLFNNFGDETYNDNDALYIYLDDSDNSVVVYLNPTDPNDPSGTGTLQTGGNAAYPEFSNFGNADTAFSIKSKKYSFCDGGDLVRYYKEGATFWDVNYPYFTRQVDVNSTQCNVEVICNLSTKLLFLTQPSTNSSTDGQIIASVTTSDPSGVEFAFESFEYGNGIQATRGAVDFFGQYTYSYTFTGLNQGSYTIHARDSKGCSIVFDTATLFATEYGTRLVGEFNDIRDERNNTGDSYQVQIKELNYTDASAEIPVMGGEPLKITVGSGGVKYSPIKGSTIEFTIRENSSTDYSTIFFGSSTRQVSDKQLIAEIYQNGTLIKKGYFLAEGYTEPYKDKPYDITARFIDGLGDLSSRLYKNISGTASAREVLFDCLEQTGLPDMKVRIISGTYASNNYDASGNLTATSNSSFDDVYVDLQSYDGLTYKDVLEGLLASFPEPMTVESQGNLWFVSPEVMDASGYSYLDFNFNGSLDASGTFVNHKSEGTVTANLDTHMMGGGGSGRDNVYKKIDVVEDRIIRESVFNSFTEDNIVGDAISDDIVGDGFLGYQNVLNGDSGSFEVKRVVERVDRPESKLIQTTTETSVVSHRQQNEYTANGYDTYSIEDRDGDREIVSTVLKKSDIGSNFRNTKSDSYFLSYSIDEGQNANSYVTSSSNIECSTSDDFEFSFDYFIDPKNAQVNRTRSGSGGSSVINQGNLPLYLKLRYELRVTDSSGVEYYLNGTDWEQTSTPRINEQFITEYFNVNTFSVKGEVPVSDNKCTVDFKIYDIDVYYYDTQGTSDIQNINASNLPEGYRIIDSATNAVNEIVLSYYELLSSDITDGTIVDASGTSDFNWVKVNSVTLERISVCVNLGSCEFAVSNISFSTLPDGLRFSDTFNEGNTSSLNNLYDFEYPVFHFNVRGNQTNERGMILNYWRDSSGSPLDGWGSGTDFSQTLVLNELLAQYKNPSRKINATFKYNSAVNATNVLKFTYDNDELYKFNQFSWMPKSRMISGELVSIGRDGEVISIGEYDNTQFSSAFNI